MRKEFKFTDNLKGILEIGEIDWTIFKDQSKIHYIGSLAPPRFGVTLFATIMEYMYFPPKTKKNGLYWLQFLNWGTIISDANRKLEVFTAKTATVSGNKKVVTVDGKEFVTTSEWTTQMLRWMIITIPAEYKPQAEACLKKINMIPASASPVLSKFKIGKGDNIVELPFIAAVKSYKLKQRPVFRGPMGVINLDIGNVHFFPVEGANIFTIESGPKDHDIINKTDPYELFLIERDMCEKINGYTDSSPEEQERIDKMSKKIFGAIDEIMNQYKPSTK